MSNDKNPGGLGYMGDLASQLYEDYIVQVVGRSHPIVYLLEIYINYGIHSTPSDPKSAARTSTFWWVPKSGVDCF